MCMFCPFHSCCLPSPTVTVLAPAKAVTRSQRKANPSRAASRGGWCQTQTATNQDQKVGEPPSHQSIRKRQRMKKGRGKEGVDQDQRLREVRPQIKGQTQRTVTKRWQNRASDWGLIGGGISLVTWIKGQLVELGRSWYRLRGLGLWVQNISVRIISYENLSSGYPAL